MLMISRPITAAELLGRVGAIVPRSAARTVAPQTPPRPEPVESDRLCPRCKARGRGMPPSRNLYTYCVPCQRAANRASYLKTKAAAR